jgi:hypothetical protein
MGKNNIKKYSELVIEKKIDFFLNNQYLMLLIIGISALLIRLYYFEPDIPFALDNLTYFSYSFDVSVQGNLPSGYSPVNNGWPAFVGIFFSIFHFDEPIHYMQLQKIISIIFSTVTIIPIYILGRHFFGRNLSLIGASFFAFEPRIIQNSLFGITEPLYIFLISMVLIMFLSQNKKMVYASFGIMALSSMVRGEGIILFFVMSIMFFVRYRKSWTVIPKYIPAVLIFILVLLPMSMYKEEIHGDDRIFGRIIEVINVHILTPEENSDDWNKLTEPVQNRIKEGKYTGISFISTGLENFSKFFIWSMIPIFILFVPIGAILIFKKINFNKLTIITCVIGLSIPAFYAYAVSSLDTRYLYPLYPMLCIVSVFAVEKYIKKINFKKIITVGLVVGILIASLSFLEYKKIDAEHEKEAFLVAQQIVKYSTGVNYYSPESQYIKVADVFTNWPSVPLHTPDGHFETSTIRISADEYDNLSEFIFNSESDGLSHLVIDTDSNLPYFLRDVFENEKKFSYLIKEYDSKEEGMKYHVKIFRIDYEEFRLLLNG